MPSLLRAYAPSSHRGDMSRIARFDHANGIYDTSFGPVQGVDGVRSTANDDHVYPVVTTIELDRR